MPKRQRHEDSESGQSRALQPAVQQLITPTLRVQSLLQALGQGWGIPFAGLMAQLTVPLSQMLAVQPLLHSLLEAWRETWQRQFFTLEPFKKYVTDQEEVAKAFSSGDLCYTPSMTPELVDRVVKMHRTGNTKGIPSIVANYYCKDHCAVLRQAVETWAGSRIFRPRMPAIRAALAAHLQANYLLSIPALLPQIEGIARDYVRKYGLTGKKGTPVPPHKGKELLEAVIKHGPLRNYAACQALLTIVADPLYLYQDFEKHRPVVRRSRRLNRHSILHGLQLPYATRINSLRAFLLLDALSLFSNTS